MEGTDIRDRLLAYRVSRGWTQKEAAKEAGVGRATVENIETGMNKKPHRATLMKLALAFEVSLDEFLSDNPPKGSGPSLPVAVLRRRAGHTYLTRSMAETVDFGEAAEPGEIRARIRELAEEADVLREARLAPSDYLPPEAMESPEALRVAREEIRGVARGFVVRVMALAEIGGGRDLIEEAERTIEEHQELNVAR